MTMNISKSLSDTQILKFRNAINLKTKFAVMKTQNFGDLESGLSQGSGQGPP